MWSGVTENFYVCDYGVAQEANTAYYYKVADETLAIRSIRSAVKAHAEQRRKEKTVSVEDFDNTVWGQRARERVKPKPWWKPYL